MIAPLRHLLGIKTHEEVVASVGNEPSIRNALKQLRRASVLLDDATLVLTEYEELEELEAELAEPRK